MTMDSWNRAERLGQGYSLGKCRVRRKHYQGGLREKGAHERLRGVVFEAQDPEIWVPGANGAEKT